MAFKLYHGMEENLPEEMSVGHVYFCTDTGKIYLDHLDALGHLTRSVANAGKAEFLVSYDGGEEIEMTIDDILGSVANAIPEYVRIKNNTDCNPVLITDGIVGEPYSVRVGIMCGQAGSGDPAPDNVRQILPARSIEIRSSGKNVAGSNMTTLTSNTAEWCVSFFHGRSSYIEFSIALRRAMGFNPVIFTYSIPDSSSEAGSQTVSVLLSDLHAYGEDRAYFVINGAFSNLACLISDPTMYNAPQVELGHAPTAFVEASAETRRTVYMRDNEGNAVDVYVGSYDAVSGELTVTHRRKLFAELTWRSAAIQGYSDVFVTSTSEIGTSGHLICSCYKTADADAFDPDAGEFPDMSAVLSGGNIFVRDSRFTSHIDWLNEIGRQEIVYPTASTATYREDAADDGQLAVHDGGSTVSAGYHGDNMELHVSYCIDATDNNNSVWAAIDALREAAQTPDDAEIPDDVWFHGENMSKSPLVITNGADDRPFISLTASLTSRDFPVRVCRIYVSDEYGEPYETPEHMVAEISFNGEDIRVGNFDVLTGVFSDVYGGMFQFDPTEIRTAKDWQLIHITFDDVPAASISAEYLCNTTNAVVELVENTATQVIDEMIGYVGDTDNLNTENKYDLVGAVNELAAKCDDGCLPAGGTAGQILIKNSSADGDASWQSIADSVAAGDTRPISSAAVYTEVGNINALLQTI